MTPASFVMLLLLAITSLANVNAVYHSKEIISGTPARPSLDIWDRPDQLEQDVIVGVSTNHDDKNSVLLISENGLIHQDGNRRTASSFQLGVSFQGLSNIDNANLNDGNTLVPPDPTCAAGKSTLIAAANSILEIRNKQGGLLYKDAFDKFFVSLGPSGLLFDPKVVYDQYADRFVLVVLDQVSPGGLGPVSDSNMPQGRHLQPTNVTGNSTILLAVSTSGSPTGVSDWYFQAINSLEVDNTDSYWADYPGLEVSPEAVYLTTNVISFTMSSQTANRLWIIDKSGFYDGGSLSYTKHDPYNGEFTLTTMPALVYGGPIGNNIGTYLVGYDGFSSSDGRDFIYVTTITNPLTSPTFSSTAVDVGFIDNLSQSSSNSPQLGTSITIEYSLRRLLDAAWRDNFIWMTTTVVPRTGPNTNQATAFWIKIDTNTLTLADKGEIGGEDIAAGTYTSYASVAVNSQGVAAFGFAASGPSIFSGAYVVGRNPSDPAGTVSSSFVVHQGLDWYNRSNGGSRNRWGDYSGMALDPVDDSFWVFNEYADTRGMLNGGEDGVWNTAWAQFLSSSTVPLTPPPTNKPTLSPTLRPTAVTPTNNPPTVHVKIPPGYCFSEANLVVVESKGMIKMKDLQIGDRVKDAQGSMVLVYSFGHYQETARVKYLQIYIKGLATPLEISDDHMVFVNGSAVPASSLSPGDHIDLEACATARIEKIRATFRNGAYAPFTTSGTILVSGVAASSFVTLQKNSSVFKLGRWETPLSMQWLARVFQAPHRIFCSLLGVDLCSRMETYNENGISTWVDAPYHFFGWMVKQNCLVMAMIFVPVLIAGLSVFALEHGWIYLLAAFLGIMLVLQRNKLIGTKK